jgi:hypothetical protein
MCLPPNQIKPLPNSPSLSYLDPVNDPLYQTRYSGRLENLINLQENWKKSNKVDSFVLRFSGTFSAPWFSRELVRAGIVKFGSNPERTTMTNLYYNTEYYTAPERRFDYNESLRANPPPETPGTFSIQRQNFSHGGWDD